MFKSLWSHLAREFSPLPPAYTGKLLPRAEVKRIKNLKTNAYKPLESDQLTKTSLEANPKTTNTSNETIRIFATENKEGGHVRRLFLTDAEMQARCKLGSELGNCSPEEIKVWMEVAHQYEVFIQLRPSNADSLPFFMEGFHPKSALIKNKTINTVDMMLYPQLAQQYQMLLKEHNVQLTDALQGLPPTGLVACFLPDNNYLNQLLETYQPNPELCAKLEKRFAQRTEEYHETLDSVV